jgi:competence protein ComEC
MEMAPMATVHLLNVKPGDCTIISHNSGRVTMMDICDGNQTAEGLIEKAVRVVSKSNYRMCESNTNPIDYAASIGITSVFRFILSHPDMDHMDGFDALLSKFECANFWDTGSRRPKPDFTNSPYREEDWDRYVRVRDGKQTGVATATRQAGARFSFANQEGPNGESHDGLHLLAPSSELVQDPDTKEEINESSYVIQYQSTGGAIILPGDAHDASWEYIRKTADTSIKNCSFLLAPHHGRDSGRSYDFLDMLQPKLTLIGCTPAKYIDYNQWYNRNLELITSNQCGNVVLETGDGFLDVYIENETFAASRVGNTNNRNAQGYCFLKRITATSAS